MRNTDLVCIFCNRARHHSAPLCASLTGSGGVVSSNLALLCFVCGNRKEGAGKQERAPETERANRSLGDKQDVCTLKTPQKSLSDRGLVARSGNICPICGRDPDESDGRIAEYVQDCKEISRQLDIGLCKDDFRWSWGWNDRPCCIGFCRPSLRSEAKDAEMLLPEGLRPVGLPKPLLLIGSRLSKTELGGFIGLDGSALGLVLSDHTRRGRLASPSPDEYVLLEDPATSGFPVVSCLVPITLSTYPPSVSEQIQASSPSGAMRPATSRREKRDFPIIWTEPGKGTQAIMRNPKTGTQHRCGHYYGPHACPEHFESGRMLTRLSCNRRICPSCWKTWSAREGKRAELTLLGAREAAESYYDRSYDISHGVLSLDPWDPTGKHPDGSRDIFTLLRTNKGVMELYDSMWKTLGPTQKLVYECECGESHRSESDHVEHVRANRDSVHKTVCTVCGRSFKSEKGLMSHKGRAHYRCQTCDQYFIDIESLESHWQGHVAGWGLDPDRPVFCESCGRSFSDYHRLQQHNCVLSLPKGGSRYQKTVFPYQWGGLVVFHPKRRWRAGASGHVIREVAGIKQKVVLFRTRGPTKQSSLSGEICDEERGRVWHIEVCDENGLYHSPHFHIVHFGFSRKGDEVYMSNGAVWKKIPDAEKDEFGEQWKNGEKRSVSATVTYLLSHCGIMLHQDGSLVKYANVVRWGGLCHSSKIERHRGILEPGVSGAQAVWHEGEHEDVDVECPIRACHVPVRELDGVTVDYDIEQREGYLEAVDPRFTFPGGLSGVIFGRTATYKRQDTWVAIKGHPNSRSLIRSIGGPSLKQIDPPVLPEVIDVTDPGHWPGGQVPPEFSIREDLLEALGDDFRDDVEVDLPALDHVERVDIGDFWNLSMVRWARKVHSKSHAQDIAQDIWDLTGIEVQADSGGCLHSYDGKAWHSHRWTSSAAILQHQIVHQAIARNFDASSVYRLALSIFDSDFSKVFGSDDDLAMPGDPIALTPDMASRVIETIAGLSGVDGDDIIDLMDILDGSDSKLARIIGSASGVLPQDEIAEWTLIASNVCADLPGRLRILARKIRISNDQLGHMLHQLSEMESEIDVDRWLRLAGKMMIMPPYIDCPQPIQWISNRAMDLWSNESGEDWTAITTIVLGQLPRHLIPLDHPGRITLQDDQWRSILHRLTDLCEHQVVEEWIRLSDEIFCRPPDIEEGMQHLNPELLHEASAIVAELEDRGPMSVRDLEQAVGSEFSFEALDACMTAGLVAEMLDPCGFGHIVDIMREDGVGDSMRKWMLRQLDSRAWDAGQSTFADSSESELMTDGVSIFTAVDLEDAELVKRIRPDVLVVVPDWVPESESVRHVSSVRFD